MKKLMGVMIMALVMAGISGAFTPVHAAEGKQVASGKEVRINLNTASAQQLTSLKGIGTKKAEAIVAFRKEHGNFKKSEDLMLVKGIGPKLYEKIKNQISVQ